MTLNAFSQAFDELWKMKRFKFKAGLLIALFASSYSADSFAGNRDVLFILRGRDWIQNQEQVMLSFDTRQDIKQSVFDSTKPTTFLIHGFTENHKVRQHIVLSE